MLWRLDNNVWGDSSFKHYLYIVQILGILQALVPWIKWLDIRLGFLMWVVEFKSWLSNVKSNRLYINYPGSILTISNIKHVKLDFWSENYMESVILTESQIL